MILLDTNVLSEIMRPRPDLRVLTWIRANDPVLATTSVAIAELAFGIAKIRPAERARHLTGALDDWRLRLSGRIYPFTEEAALIYGDLMGEARRAGRTLSTADGMIASIAMLHDSPLATRNVTDFGLPGLSVINPWDE